jgi:hypothetical protein
MSKKVKKAFEVVRNSLDEESEPEKLTKLEYKELLEELLSDLEGRLEAVDEELDS